MDGEKTLRPGSIKHSSKRRCRIGTDAKGCFGQAPGKSRATLFCDVDEWPAPNFNAPLCAVRAMYGGGFGFATVGAAVLAIFLVRWAIKSPKKDALPIEAILTAIIMVATIAQAAIAFENNKSSERGVETQKEAVKLQASQARIESLLANLTTAQGTSQLVLQDGYLVNQFFELPGENFTGPYHPQAVLTIVNRGLHATAIDDVQVIAHDRNGTAFEFPKTLLDSPTPIVNWSWRVKRSEEHTSELQSH